MTTIDAILANLEEFAVSHTIHDREELAIEASRRAANAIKALRDALEARKPLEQQNEMLSTRIKCLEQSHHQMADAAVAEMRARLGLKLNPNQLRAIAADKPVRDLDACIRRIEESIQKEAEQGMFEIWISPSHRDDVELLVTNSRYGLSDLGRKFVEQFQKAGFNVTVDRHVICISWSEK